MNAFHETNKKKEILWIFILYFTVLQSKEEFSTRLRDILKEFEFFLEKVDKWCRPIN